MTIEHREKYESDYEKGRSELVLSLLPTARGTERALDIGCGVGVYCNALSDRGWCVTAVDMEEANINKATRHAEEALVGDALSVLGGLGRDQFGLAVALELIEHMPAADGDLLLAGIHRVLQEDGRLILSTPNRMSVEGLGNYYWGEKIRNWGKWTAWDDSHVTIYSAPEILAKLRRNGFRIETVYGYWYQGTLPLGLRLALPWHRAGRWPLNRLGFNTVVSCRRSNVSCSGQHA